MVVLGSTTTWRDYIVADGQIVALRSKTGSTVSMLYTIPDHLGSTAIVTDAAINIERDSYDAWGRRRNPDGTPDTSCSLTSQTNRGYTGQEMLDSQCLINMNARIYDPTLGHFQSADSIVSDPMYGQAYNRYGYVYGRPLGLVDPSGRDPVVNGGQKQLIPVDPDYIETVVVTGQRTQTNYDNTPLSNSGPAYSGRGGEQRGGGGQLVPCGQSGFVGGVESTTVCGNLHSPPVPSTPLMPGLLGTNRNDSCSSNGSLAGRVGDWAGTASNVFSGVAVGSGLAALATSETVVGGLTFGAIAGGAENLSLGATGIQAGAQYLDRNYGGLRETLAGAAFSLGVNAGFGRVLGSSFVKGAEAAKLKYMVGVQAEAGSQIIQNVCHVR